MAISDFLNFAFLNPKISKNHFFTKNVHKIQNFQNFQKTVLYVVELAVFNQCAKFQLDTIILAPKRDVFVFPIVPNDDVIHLNANF